jgi:hypothetical protein
MNFATRAPLWLNGGYMSQSGDYGAEGSLVEFYLTSSRFWMLTLLEDELFSFLIDENFRGDITGSTGDQEPVFDSLDLVLT